MRKTFRFVSASIEGDEIAVAITNPEFKSGRIDDLMLTRDEAFHLSQALIKILRVMR